ncbi:hypothetical protein A3A76_01265 [Candidatus Woesebacteria bacterium RIFCSPLOWO2_01_FULL_39_23]|uniref:Peptidase M48 domain-containing protein n=1 Tax=Candidatus Woesebacteria bacterium RIFCSPHIGHO2_01_FULL_40_22 TaxID=1802499 RepID=A0A1F7YGJ1_9BACT|nr:MAG: hypothetical protein A2141_05105 [Candidatus Woesebacteria bacterium RBG_16_40_11]OGM26456.1 MAG: hypothetical protein A2628_02860 [Candidatus Woesebacteria bacterium RIFCSPHIGHO2_01_FULL_40_22]OGM37625.1 MAG: hypothetical protein A3E41_05375 [Candidatus Woesebacteria bacterium RIFCSPHIGHO2_12_FULL_38_9]OGM62909.1 MAG: hypothetical protein A3A76_01265 [Candidatus Woesebacteria bacterium RIFCSPLOWO2_01_FULL_39_23]
MKKEISYFLSILLVFTFSVVSLFTLFKRYSGLTFEHFRETCKVIASSFFSTGAHYVGFILTAIVLMITLGLFLKTLLSCIKTKRKLEVLLQKQIYSLPQKLKFILERNGIRKDLIIIVEEVDVYAFTIDWFSPKIVISTSLIEKLNQNQLEAVTLHEYYHLKNRHPLLLIVGEILSSSLLMLPVLRDLTRKMRTVLEKEADLFVSNQQKTTRHLNLALETVSSQNRFKIYPNFSRRTDYKIKRINFLVFVVIILAGLFLFKFPGDTHTIQAMGNSDLSNCEDNLCSTHCPTNNINQSSYITPAFQSTFASFNNNVD